VRLVFGEDISGAARGPVLRCHGGDEVRILEAHKVAQNR
jgi:hypothetical protein